MEKEEIPLKEFFEKIFTQNTTIKNMQMGMKLAEKLIELEALENFINVMYGVSLDIKVRSAERKEGRYYGKSLIDDIAPLSK